MGIQPKYIVELVLLSLICLMVFLVVMIPACSQLPPPEVETLQGITRIMMHSPNKYTFFARRDSQPEQLMHIFTVQTTSGISIFDDVHPEEMCWIRFLRYDMGANRHYLNKLEIHLHSVKEINGAGWDHGKHGSGQTTVLE